MMPQKRDEVILYNAYKEQQS